MRKLGAILTVALILAAGLARADGFLFYGNSTPRCQPLGVGVTTTVFDLDATCTSSYGGSGQTWANLETTPADSSAQSAYDFYRGNTVSATTDDPTFNGTPDTAAAYFSVDGGDYFSLASGTNTTFLHNLHDTTSGGGFWISFCGNIASSAGNSPMFHTKTSTSDTGFGFYQPANNGATEGGFFRVNMETDVTNGVVAYPPAVDFCAVISIDPVATTNNVRVWIDGNYQYIQRSVDFTNATGNATTKALIGLFNGAFLLSGSKIYSVAGGNDFIDTTEADKIFARMRARHLRTYAVTAPALLGDTVSSTVFQVDANIIASVADGAATSPNWLNADTSPADSSAQTAYDFTNTGALPFDSMAPKSSRYNPAAGDYFILTGAATAFNKDLHKTTGGQDFWLTCAFNSDGTWAADNYFITTSPAYTAASDGFMLNGDSSETIQPRSVGTAAVSQANDALTGFTSGDHLIVMSYSHSNNNWRVAANSNTFSDVAHTFSTSLLDAVGKLTIGAESDGGTANADVDWYGCAMGNAYISNTELAQITAYYETLHGRNYVP